VVDGIVKRLFRFHIFLFSQQRHPQVVVGGAAFGILGQLVSESGDMLIRIPGQRAPLLRVGHGLLLTKFAKY
jgi:hypothetical protein